MSQVHAISPGISLEVASHTDCGLEREENQDTALVALLPAALAFGVCDGMGGVAGGQIASSRAVSVIEEVLRARAPETEDSAARALFDAIEDATQRLFAIARRDVTLRGMGTTATIATVAGDRLVVAQIGDSRAYLHRLGKLTQLTRDQTLAQMMVEKGQLAPQDVATFPHANVILQAVGTAEHVDVDLRAIRLFKGDVILVCSDGLHGPVGDALLAQLLGEAADPAAACEALVDRALAYGGPDNVTCVVVRVTGERLDDPPSAEVDVTRCVLAPTDDASPDIAMGEEAPTPSSGGKAPLSHLWPLRWGPWASKKTP